MTNDIWALITYLERASLEDHAKAADTSVARHLRDYYSGSSQALQGAANRLRLMMARNRRAA